MGLCERIIHTPARILSMGFVMGLLDLIRWSKRDVYTGPKCDAERVSPKHAELLGGCQELLRGLFLCLLTVRLIVGPVLPCVARL